MSEFEFRVAYDAKRAALAAAEPADARVTFESRSGLIDGFRTEATIRNFRLTVDEPESLGGTDTGPNPVELVLAALGTCQEITYRLYADALGIPVDRVSVKVEGDLDLRGFFSANEHIRPGFVGIRAVVSIDSPASEEDLQRLKDTVDRHCPVLDVLRNPVPVALRLETVQSAAAAE